MPFYLQPITYPALVYCGCVLIFLGFLRAWRTRTDTRRLLTGLCLADVGYAMIGFGVGGAVAAPGALLMCVYQGVTRCLAWVCLARLAQVLTPRGTLSGYSMETMQGVGRVQPCIAALFALSMFASMGVSPFLTPDAKPLILYGAWLTFVPFLGGVLVFANLAMAAFTIVVVHNVWLKSPCIHSDRVSGAVYTAPRGCYGLMAVLFAALVLMGVSGHEAARYASMLAGYAPEFLPGFEVVWVPASVLVYVGAFVVFVTGQWSLRIRNILAVGIMAAAFCLTWQDAGAAPLGRLFALIVSGVGMVVTLYSCGYIHGSRQQTNGYFFFLLLMFASLLGLALCPNIGGFYVFWELMTFSSYVLVTYERTEQALRAGLKYFLMCGLAAAVMLPGLLFLAAMGGSFEITQIAAHIRLSPFGVLLIGGLVLVGCGVKAGLVPGHGWLPDAHPAAPSSISAPLSGILTKAGVFGLVQILLVIIGYDALSAESRGSVPPLGMFITALGLLTMVYGEIQALRQQDLKRLLAFSTMGQVGEIAVTLGLCTYLALNGALLHTLNHAVMKDLLFLASGAFILRSGSRNLEDLRGLGKKMPVTAVCMTIGLLSILGLPPFSGFISKFSMVYALAHTHVLLAAVMLLTSMAGCIYYTRILKTLLFEPYGGQAGASVPDAPKAMQLAMVMLACVCVGFGLFPQGACSLVKPVLDGLSAAGQLAAAPLPSLHVTWPPHTIVLTAGALLPVFLRRSPRNAGIVTAALFAVAAVMVVLWGRSLDGVSFFFSLIICIFGALNVVYSTGYLAHGHAQWRFYACFALMGAGLTGVAGSRDLFSFFFFWELMSSWPLYVAIVHEETPEAVRAGFKYFFFNVLGAAFLFCGVAMLGNWAGSFEFSTISRVMTQLPHWQTALSLGVMAVGFLMKAAQLPLRIDIQMHPAAAPTPVSGYISSVLLKSSIFGLIKLFFVMGGAAAIGNLAMEQAPTVFALPLIMNICVWIGGVTIVLAAALAIFQSDLKLVLIYSTVSQIGYMIVAVSVGSPLGLAGGLLHAVNHVLFKDLLFLVAGAVIMRTGRQSLDSLGGLGRQMPKTMILCLIGALCVVGVPPSNGFTSKWIIYHALMQQGFVLVAVLSLVGSVLTLAYMVKLMHGVFLGQPEPGLMQVTEAPGSMLWPMRIMAGGCVLTSVFPGLILMPINTLYAQWVPGGMLLDVAPWGIVSGAGAWNATATAALFAAGVLVCKLAASRFTVRVRETDVHTCGMPPELFHLHTGSRDVYSGLFGRRVAALVRKAAGQESLLVDAPVLQQPERNG